MELERAYHKLVITPDEQRDPVSEMGKLHELILMEGNKQITPSAAFAFLGGLSPRTFFYRLCSSIA
jgi:hypothetical protein